MIHKVVQSYNVQHPYPFKEPISGTQHSWYSRSSFNTNLLCNTSKNAFLSLVCYLGLDTPFHFMTIDPQLTFLNLSRQIWARWSTDFTGILRLASLSVSTQSQDTQFPYLNSLHKTKPSEYDVWFVCGLSTYTEIVGHHFSQDLVVLICISLEMTFICCDVFLHYWFCAKKKAGGKNDHNRISFLMFEILKRYEENRACNQLK